MSDPPLEEDESSSEQSGVDDYADLDDFEDGDMLESTSAAILHPSDPHDEEDVQMAHETNVDVAVDLQNLREKFDHLAIKASIVVAVLHGDVISLYLPFYFFLNNGLKLAWKEYEHSHIVVDIKIDVTQYRHAKNLPLVTVSLSTGVISPPFQLFCNHLRTIAQNYLGENFKDLEKNVLSGLFEELLERIENLSNFCCFCDKPLGDEGGFLQTFCSSLFCSFQGDEFRRAHSNARPASHVFFHDLEEKECFKSLNFCRQALILHESPDQILDFEKRRALKATRFLYYDDQLEDWVDFIQRSDRHSSIRVSRQTGPISSESGRLQSVLCEVIDDLSTLIELTRNDFLVLDIRNLRFRLDLKAGTGDSPPISMADELRLRNWLATLQRPINSGEEEEVEAGFKLDRLPADLLVRVLQLNSRWDALRLKRVSKRLHDVIQANESQLRREDRGAWKAITIHVEGHSLKEVVAGLAELMEITRAEFNNLCRVEVEGFLQLLLFLRELRIVGFDPYDRSVITTKRFLKALPSSLVSLSFENALIRYQNSVFGDPRIQNLQQLHVYGSCNPIPDEIFQALKVKRLCLEDVEVTLEALRLVVDEWRNEEREIEAMCFGNVVESLWQVVPGARRYNGPGGQLRAPTASPVTGDQILRALRDSPMTSQITQNIGGTSMEEDESSSEQDGVDDYADLDDFDDEAMLESTSAAILHPSDPHDEEDVQMAHETNVDVAVDLQNLREKFDHLAIKASIAVAALHGDMISLYLPFYFFLNKGHQLAWKEYEHSHIVVDLKINLTEYRRSKNLPLVTVSLSTGMVSPPLQLFCNHLRTIAQNYLRENFKDLEKSVLSGLFEELLGRIENLNNFCCFCDKPLGDKGGFLPTFCSSSFCSFQGDEFRRAHANTRPASHVFFHDLEEKECFKSLNFCRQALLLHESPDQILDFEKRRRDKATRFLYYDNQLDDWVNFIRRPDRHSSIRVSRQSAPIYSASGILQAVLCEVIDDPSTLIELTRNDFLVLDIRNLRFRLDLKAAAGDSPPIFMADELRLRNWLATLQGSIKSAKEEVRVGCNLGHLPSDLLVRVLQLNSRWDALRLKRASKRLHDVIQANESQLRKFHDIRMIIYRKNKQMVKIRLDKLTIREKRLLEVVVELPNTETSSIADGVVDLEDLDEEEEEPDGVEEEESMEEVLDQDVEAGEKKPIFDNCAIEGGDGAWKAITIHVEGHSLKEVVAGLADLMEITRAEFNNLWRTEVVDFLRLLPVLRELRVVGFDHYDRSVVRPKRFLKALPPSLTSLSFDNALIRNRNSVFGELRVQNLQQLHVYGSANPVQNEVFQALRVKRLCLEHVEVSLDALRFVVDQWKNEEREIEAIHLNVVTSFSVLQRGLPPGHYNGPPRQMFVPTAAPLTRDQIFLALGVISMTSKIYQNIGISELLVEVSSKTNNSDYYRKTFVQLVACSF